MYIHNELNIPVYYEVLSSNILCSSVGKMSAVGVIEELRSFRGLER